MHIYSVYDPAFKPYGRVVEGLDEARAELAAALRATPLPDATDYVPEDPALQSLPAAAAVRDSLFGGMPAQLGWCNGHNTRLNCLEYHRDSEFNLGAEDFILLLAKLDEVENGVLDTGRVKAFRALILATVLCSASRFRATISSAQMPPQAIIITSTLSSSL